jgi:hypothetical protein
MITTITAENALKNIYLDSIAYDINNGSHPLLTILNKRVKSCSGTYAKAYAGDNEMVRPLDNLYGTFQISDAATLVKYANLIEKSGAVKRVVEK